MHTYTYTYAQKNISVTDTVIIVTMPDLKWGS